MKNRKKILTGIVALFLFSCVGCSSANKVKLDPDHPQTIAIWHYYSGAQQEAFEKLVDEFNRNEGLEKGIRAKAENYGSVEQLAQEVQNSATNQVGAGELPDIFLGYTDTVYQIDQEGLIVDLDQYFTEDELQEYVPAFIEEGRMGEDEALKIFPTAKSTEIFMMNLTDWQPFAEESGVTLEQLSTLEGITSTAEVYYKWSGGKAFFGRDAFANYMISGSMQLGVELMKVEDEKVTFQVDEDVMRKLWDNYYIPSIYGYFGSYGKFRSDDVKVGDLLAFVGSSTAASYFPSEVFENDDEGHPIDAIVLPVPVFENGKPCVIQQGAGMAVIKSEKEQEYAAVEFIKWFTEKERNLDFCVQSGYLPVKTEALKEDALQKTIDKSAVSINDNMKDSLTTSADEMRNKNPYTNKMFAEEAGVRAVLGTSMPDKIEEDLEWIASEEEQGRPRKEAVKSLDTDENFQEWLEAFKTALDETQNKEKSEKE